MTIERLTAEDQIMLWPDEFWPQDIGAAAVLDGAGFDLDAVRTAVAARLPLVPRFRQRLVVPPERLGSPLWVDDSAFDISHHVGMVRLNPPGDDIELLDAIERLRRRRLDRARPLWEMWFLTGMSEGRVGMFVRTHHVVADGMAGVSTLAAFTDTTADVIPTPAEPWTAAPPPSEADMLDDVRWRRREARSHLASGLAHPMAAIRRTLAMGPALRELLVDGTPPPTSLDHGVGSRRAIALVRSRLDVCKEVARRHDATVNDVFLNAVTGGLRGLLRDRGEALDGLTVRAYVPISLRHGQYADARGNQITQMVVPLPVGIADPVARLHLISAETLRRKTRVRPSIGGFPVRGLAGRAALWLIRRQRVNVETADLFGPPVPLYLAGMRMLEVFPLVPLIGRVSLGIGALSYAGQFNIGIVGDGDAYPDLDVFAAAIEGELASLESSRVVA